MTRLFERSSGLDYVDQYDEGRRIDTRTTFEGRGKMIGLDRGDKKEQSLALYRRCLEKNLAKKHSSGQIERDQPCGVRH